jgi:beta propeller repeat protein
MRRIFAAILPTICGLNSRAPISRLAFLVIVFCAGHFSLEAQQQQQGLCAQVKIQILQELTLERVGFEATLEITDNLGDEPLTDFSATLTFQNSALAGQGVDDDSSAFFFVRAPTVENISDVNGSGVIAPSTTARIRWFIIPKTAAGGTNAHGIFYNVGAKLAGKLKGIEIPIEVLRVIPAPILVKPEPQLDITYFQPVDVQGDDPFTPEVESPIPFTVGVLVKNSGFGLARNVQIDSQQPKIVEARRGLLLIAQLLGTRLNDSQLNNANLRLNVGTLNPGETRKGSWDMITSLSGQFVEFKASYTHASELGGFDTSIIKSLNAYLISHEVLNDQPGRDRITDFLADTDRDTDQIPDTLFESEGQVVPVNYLTGASIASTNAGAGTFQVNLNADHAGWGYIRLNDPGQAKLRIAGVVRSDGKILNTNNFWTNIRYEKVTNNKLTFFNIFDLVDLGTYSYVVTYAPALVDTNPPVTTLKFAGPVTLAGGKNYVTPDTQMYFLSQDESPVSIVYSVTNSPFLPAYPFRLTTPGEYDIRFYATDNASNIEQFRTNIVVVSTAPPALSLAILSSPSLVGSGDALSIRPAAARLRYFGQAGGVPADALIDVYQGVVGWATVAGVPSSPTADTSANLIVGGDNVDFYRYQLDGGSWSADTAVGQTIALSSLAGGSHTVAVLGRSRYGNFLPDSNAVQVSWTINASAPATRVTGTPATPTRQSGAVLSVGGSGVTDYRWTINNGFYRAETSVTNPIILSQLSSTQQVVAVQGKVGGNYQFLPTTISWTVNPSYGSDLSSLTRVRTFVQTNIGGTLQTIDWDGRNDAGVLMAPGWYTMLLRISDPLGRTNFTTRLVQMNDFTGNSSALADVNRGAKNPDARGRWSVWQDQSEGNWKIFAQDLGSNAPVVRVTDAGLNQENPRTDGRYVVWQARQTNGSWDIFVKDLNSNAPPQQITITPDQDEINPVVDWPWIVFQTRAAGVATAPWQLRAFNMLSNVFSVVSPSTQDQVDPDVQAGRVVWQDWRDVGAGEIYFKNLETGQAMRITANPFGQYHPAIFDNWIVWQDNRNTEVDIYGYHLLRNTEVRITNTPENETRPHLNGPWLVCEEDSLGAGTANLRMIHLESLRAVPLTRTPSAKAHPALAGGRVVWQETQTNVTRILAVDVPALQAVFQNRNAIAVTESMATYQANAYSLLTLWHAQAGVQEITRYTSLVPQVTTETVSWVNGAPSGPNFQLTAGSFLWVRFDGKRVLDLGSNNSSSLNLVAGLNVFGYAGFPNQLSAYRLMRQLGLANVRAVRMLDAESGRWVVAELRAGQLLGHDFTIPNVSVLMLDLVNPVNNWTPQAP